MIVINVFSGTLTPKLADTEIGPVCHSRWITFQSRILRLYMTSGVSRNILPKLRKLALYVLNIYFPMHMNIKYKSSIVDGCVNLFKEVSLIKKYVKSKVEQEYILSSLQVNSYFAHPHNVLISMLADESYVIRKEAIDIIVDLRNLDYGEQSLDYYLPKVNFEAVSYSKLCSMSKIDERWVYLTFMNRLEYVTEPPLTKNLDLSQFLLERFSSDLPCHTQSVERLVKLTTEATKRVCGRVNQSAEGMLVVKGRSEASK